MSGRRHSAESLAKMRANRKGLGIGVAGKYERTPEIRDKISAGVSKVYQGQPDFSRGRWVHSFKTDKDVFVRSSYEERVIAILDAHPLVEDFETEPLIIIYEFEGRTHRYLPDLKVVSEGGIVTLWEIKPDWAMKVPRVWAKIAALNDYVSKHNINANIVNLADIEKMELKFGITPEVYAKSDNPYGKRGV